MSVGEERAALRASVDAEVATRSSIVTDLLRNACARACPALSPAALLPRLCLELICYRR
jgi:hypothetical protein